MNRAVFRRRIIRSFEKQPSRKRVLQVGKIFNSPPPSCPVRPQVYPGMDFTTGPSLLLLKPKEVAAPVFVGVKRSIDVE